VGGNARWGEAVSDADFIHAVFRYSEEKCCACNVNVVGCTADGIHCIDCARKILDIRQGNHWANHVLRRCEEDAEFRERLRKALGVHP